MCANGDSIKFLVRERLYFAKGTRISATKKPYLDYSYHKRHTYTWDWNDRQLVSDHPNRGDAYARKHSSITKSTKLAQFGVNFVILTNPL